MSKFIVLDFQPPGVSRQPLPAKERLPIRLKAELYNCFKEELLRPKSPFGMMMMTVPGSDPFPVKMQTIGDTTLLAIWHRGIDPTALSVMLSDIDKREDARAMREVEELLVGESQSLRPAFQSLIAIIRNEPRPLAATVHFDEPSYDSQAIRVCSRSLAEAFFDQFGASAE